MANWTVPNDVIVRWLNTDKPLPDDATISVFINDFEQQILTKYPRIQERIDDGLISVDFIKRVVSGWVIEFFQSGGTPYSSETQSYTGVGSRSVTMGGSARTSTNLSLSDLSVFAPESKSRIISVNMLPNFGRSRYRYCLETEIINDWGN